ncbi:hypothetical protein MMC13_000974 [Lambiella insularis]|nr:hypothetical protein [Lambiella insularis]
MPYNNTAIPPSDEVTGTTALPCMYDLARVKKILQADEEIGPVSNQAAFVVTKAAELFIQHFAEQALNISKTDPKPRRNIQYKDVANAVARQDNLEFLSDLIPRTTTWREHTEKKARDEGGPIASRRIHPLPAGQTTINGTRPQPRSTSERVNSEETTVDDDATMSPEEHTSRPVAAESVNGNSSLVFEHYNPKAGSYSDGANDDIEMS